MERLMQLVREVGLEKAVLQLTQEDISDITRKNKHMGKTVVRMRDDVSYILAQLRFYELKGM